MIKKLLGLAALAAAVTLAPAPQSANALTGLGAATTPANAVAQVRYGGGHIGGMHIGGMGHFRGGGGGVRFHGFNGGGLNFRPHGFRGHHFYGGPSFAYAPYRHHRHFRGFYGYGYLPYAYSGAYYGGGYGNGCYWLKVRALETGNPYWWERYEDCID